MLGWLRNLRHGKTIYQDPTMARYVAEYLNANLLGNHGKKLPNAAIEPGLYMGFSRFAQGPVLCLIDSADRVHWLNETGRHLTAHVSRYEYYRKIQPDMESLSSQMILPYYEKSNDE